MKVEEKDVMLQTILTEMKDRAERAVRNYTETECYPLVETDVPRLIAALEMALEALKWLRESNFENSLFDFDVAEQHITRVLNGEKP